jgi:hypothetical protein
MAGEITKFEIESWGDDSACLKIRVNKERGTVTHEYNSVPKRIIMKFLNQKSIPTESEVSHWIAEEERKYKAKNGISEACCSSGTWWKPSD